MPRHWNTPLPSARHFWSQTCGSDIELLAQVRSLLDAHESSLGFIERPAVERAGLAQPFEPWDWHGRRLGNYRIVSELGRGGMSHVYKAVRDDDQYYKEVAIKLLRPGLDTHSLLQRLRDERQMLASSSHPNIAQLLDGGVTETGAPYLVMEYIEGQPIDEYCEQRGLNIAARLDSDAYLVWRRSLRASAPDGSRRSQGRQHPRDQRRGAEAAGFRYRQAARTRRAMRHMPWSIRSWR